MREEAERTTIKNSILGGPLPSGGTAQLGGLSLLGTKELSHKDAPLIIEAHRKTRVNPSGVQIVLVVRRPQPARNHLLRKARTLTHI